MQNTGCDPVNSKTGWRKEVWGRPPDTGVTIKIHNCVALVACHHPGFGDEGGKLIDRNLELADRNRSADDHASRQSFDISTAAFIFGRAPHELTGRKRDHL